MTDIFDPGGLTDWWDVPADYFTGGMVDYSQLGGGLDPSQFSLTGLPDSGGLDPSQFSLGGAGGDQWYYDTQTGQILSLLQVQQIDPTFTATPQAEGVAAVPNQINPQGYTLGVPALPGGTPGVGPATGGGLDPSQYRLPPANDPWWGSMDAKTIIGALTAAGGLGALGLGIGSLFGGNNPANQTTSQTSSGGRAPMTPEMMSLLGSTGGLVGSPGGGAGGVGGAAGGGGAGLLGLSNMMSQNLMGSGQGGAQGSAQRLGQPGAGIQGGGGPQQGGQVATPQQGNWQGYPGYAGGQMPPQVQGRQPQQGGGQGLIGQQSNVLGGLQNQIPQLNPAIMQALGMQAGGMAQGYLPSLSDPQAQARIQAIYQPGFDALSYNSDLALSAARDQLMQRGFQAPDLREGPTQALTAPILAAQQLGRSQLYGQMAGAQLDLASRLPMLGSQLNAQNYNTQMQPFNAGLGLAGAYNQPIQTQGQFPLSLLDILQRGQGTTQTVNTVGPQPSLTQQLGQVAPLVGAAGSMFGSAGNMLWPQQQQQVGLSGIMPRYY